MGRIKSIAVKKLGNELIRQYGNRFSEDFEKNKKALEEVKRIRSKKIRNIVASYIAKEMKKIKESGI